MCRFSLNENFIHNTEQRKYKIWIWIRLIFYMELFSLYHLENELRINFIKKNSSSLSSCKKSFCKLIFFILYFNVLIRIVINSHLLMMFFHIQSTRVCLIKLKFSPLDFKVSFNDLFFIFIFSNNVQQSCVFLKFFVFYKKCENVRLRFLELCSAQTHTKAHDKKIL